MLKEAWVDLGMRISVQKLENGTSRAARGPGTTDIGHDRGIRDRS